MLQYDAWQWDAHMTPYAYNLQFILMNKYHISGFRYLHYSGDCEELRWALRMVIRDD